MKKSNSSVSLVCNDFFSVKSVKEKRKEKEFRNTNLAAQMFAKVTRTSTFECSTKWQVHHFQAKEGGEVGITLINDWLCDFCWSHISPNRLITSRTCILFPENSHLSESVQPTHYTEHGKMVNINSFHSQPTTDNMGLRGL